MKADTLKKVFPVIAVTAVVFIAVFLLGLTDTAVRPMIEWQREQKIQRMLREMFPEMSHYTFTEDIYTIYAEEAEVGYAFMAVGRGYGGYIDILVGLEDETRLRGISIIRHLESPGLGAKITEPEFRSEFSGLNIEDVVLKYDGGEIDAITGATISSRAVIDAVRTTAIEKVKAMSEGKERE